MIRGMSVWTHRLCERCYYDSDFGVITDGEHVGAYRRPVQVKDVEPSACCMCGGFVALTGIFVRKDPSELMCHGQHEPDQLSTWSSVALDRPGTVDA